MERVDGYLCWPFTTKGHFHLPSGIAPVLMDVKARYQKEITDKNFLYLPHSWNIAGKPITDQALVNITGMTKSELRADDALCSRIISDNLQEIMTVSASLAEQNINQSKQLMQPLGLMESGMYSGKNCLPFEFRDDADEYKLFIQHRFLDWYKRGMAYMKFEQGKPSFHLDIEKLYREKPFEELVSGLNTSRETAKEFRNNYRIYDADLPVSTIGGYGTPIPLYVDNYGNIEIPEDTSQCTDPRLNSENRNHLLIVKPLINCYLFAEYLAGKFNGFDSISIANDYHMTTRVNFVSLLLSEKNYQTMNLHIFNLLRDQDGNVYSFKRGVLQDIDNLENKARGLARFTIIRNTKLGYGNSGLNVDVATFDKIHRILGEDREWSGSDRAFSRMFKKEVSISETVKRGLERGDVSQVMNFLSDVLIQNPGNLTARYYLLLFL